MNRDTFSDYHPFINLIFFCMVLILAMCLMHPACLAVSLISALVYGVSLRGAGALRFALLGMLPMIMLAMVFNPAFNHRGATILTYLPSGNPLTLESIVYGAAAGAMLASVLLWFLCFNRVITSDKFVYMTGRVIPSLSLVLSMALRFVPVFRARAAVVTEAQRCVGNDVSSGNLFRRFRAAVTIISIMVTWSLENAIETADSMKSRGYGLPGRTAFSIYSFRKRDLGMLIWLLVSGGYVVVGWMTGGLDFQYYPVMTGSGTDLYGASILAAYGALCMTPVIVKLREDSLWKYSKSTD